MQATTVHVFKRDLRVRFTRVTLGLPIADPRQITLVYLFYSSNESPVNMRVLPAHPSFTVTPVTIIKSFPKRLDLPWE